MQAGYRKPPRPTGVGVCADPGFSLAELMVCLAVVGILSLQALPSLRQWVMRRGVQDLTEAIQDDLRLARTHAMRMEMHVTLCARAQPADDGRERCAPDRNPWSDGWLVFQDGEQLGQIDDGDRILRVHQVLPHHGRLLSTLDHISFMPSGVSTNAAARMTALPPGIPINQMEHPQQALVCINKPGRSRVVWGTSC